MKSLNVSLRDALRAHHPCQSRNQLNTIRCRKCSHGPANSLRCRHAKGVFIRLPWKRLTDGLGSAERLYCQSLDLDIPEIDCGLRAVQEEGGAEFEGGQVPLTFGNDPEALAALELGVALVDRSHWGRLRVSGDDRLRFLHGQSTADFTSLKPGQGCRTVFVNRHGRIIDMASCLIQGSSVLLILSPSTTSAVKDRLEQYIFFGDKVEVQDVSGETTLFTLAGPGSDDLVARLGAGQLVGREEGAHAMFGVGQQPVLACVSAELGRPGYSFLASEGVAADLWQQMVALGAVPMGEAGWEQARILAGRPAAGHELTEEYNPLEAGLFSAMSTSKGCYIGQETLSKLMNLDAVKQQLWGLDVSSPVAGGAEISDGINRIGVATSVTQRPDGRTFALGFIRCRSKGKQVKLEGRQVLVAGCDAVVTGIPFATRFLSGAHSEDDNAGAIEPKAEVLL